MAAPWHEHGHRFLRYEPSPLEREWFELVNATRPLGCGVWHPDAVLAARVSANVTALAEMTPSQMVYADGHGREQMAALRAETWRAMEHALREGKARLEPE